ETDAKKAAAKGNEVGELVVVGSRIRRDSFNSASPVQVVTHDETTLAGFGSTTDALQSVGITTGAAQINNAFGGFVTNGGPGANTLSLRGLGASRTLVLINGRRVSPAGTRGSVGSADLNVLPNAIIDHVEILKDGASSIYGSDAIAGVVNVITRNRLNGVILEGHYAKTQHGGGDESRASVVAGKTTDRWSIEGSFDYYERSDLTLGQRDWTRCNTDMLINRTTGASLDFIDPLTGQPKCYPITGTGSNGVTINTIGTNTTNGIGAAGSTAPGTIGRFNRFRPNPAVTLGVPGFEGVGGGANSLGVRDTFEPAMLNKNLISPEKVYTGFLQGSYDLQALGDAQAYGELLVNERDSNQTGYRQLSLDYIKGSSLIPSNLAFSTFSPVPTAVTSGQPVGVRAFIGFGNDRSNQKVDYAKGTAGIRGNLVIMPLPNWKYDGYVSYAKSDADYTARSFLTDRVANSLNVVAAPAGFTGATTLNASGAPVTCAINITTPGAGCVPAPVLNAQTIGGQLPSAYRNYIFVPVTGNTQYAETTFSATADGPLFRLPAGDLKAAVGVEYRQQKIDDQPPLDSVNGNLYNLTSAAVTKGSDHVLEVYGELEAPILKDAPFAHELTFNVSGRYTDYKSYGSDETYKVTGLWAPTDWLSFRSTYGTSFRAPALFEQFLGATSGFLSSSVDPCNNYGAAGTNPTLAANCAKELPGQPNFQATSSVAVLTAGGADQGLKAETSTNLTVGMVLQPHLPEMYGHLDVAFDYFDIKIDNGVDRLGAQNLLTFCYNDPGFRTGGQGFCRFVDARAPGSNTLTVHDNYTNVASFKTKGYEVNLRWQDEVGPGRLRVNLDLTRYMTQATKNFSDQDFTEFNGTLDNPKWGGTVDANYKWREWEFAYGVDWIGKMQSYDLLGFDPAGPRILDVPDYFLHRMSVRYTSENNWAVTAGVRNLFDKNPPTISGNNFFYNRVGNAPLYSGYDYVGRRFFMTVSKEF
ncbi:MAG: TonB-dependent receptor, partial [Phenylobacterium sp.]|nr:TonB-dependent receptor [Phenylobacterium sp.]